MRPTHTSEIAVGSTVYVFDVNRRVYDRSSGATSAPIYREHFKPETVTGETSRSWVVGRTWSAKKIDKKTRAGIYDEQGVNEACEVYELMPLIYRAMHGADQVLTLDQLRQLAAWLGVERKAVTT